MNPEDLKLLLFAIGCEVKTRLNTVPGPIEYRWSASAKISSDDVVFGYGETQAEAVYDCYKKVLDKQEDTQ